MSESKQIVDLDPKDFKLNDYDNVRIIMPAKPELSAEDIDAQLLDYAKSTGMDISSVDELDDTWVQSFFDGMSTLDEVREAIKEQYDHEVEFEYNDIKFHACCDALLARLEGEVDEDLLAANIEVARESNLRRLEEMHISLEQYLREEHLTPDQYEDKLHDETLRQMRLNVALDLEADVLNMQVGNHEITEYLSSPDPEKFLEEIREKGMVEQARQAAVRVRTMRRIVETAIIKEEGAPDEPVCAPEPEPEEDEDFVMPDFENLPAPKIRNDLPNKDDEFDLGDLNLDDLKL